MGHAIDTSNVDKAWNFSSMVNARVTDFALYKVERERVFFPNVYSPVFYLFQTLKNQTQYGSVFVPLYHSMILHI